MRISRKPRRISKGFMRCVQAGWLNILRPLVHLLAHCRVHTRCTYPLSFFPPLSLSLSLSLSKRDVAGAYSYAKSDTCLFPWMVPRRGSLSFSTGRAIARSFPSFSLPPPSLSLSLSLSFSSHGGTRKPFAKVHAHTHGGQRWTCSGGRHDPQA
jgi:hypothetical protein